MPYSAFPYPRRRQEAVEGLGQLASRIADSQSGVSGPGRRWIAVQPAGAPGRMLK